MLFLFSGKDNQFGNGNVKTIRMFALFLMKC